MISEKAACGSDRSKRRRSPEALQECAAYRQNLATGQFEYVSPVVEQLTGFSADEMYAMPPDAWLARIHPADRPRVRGGIERGVSGGCGVIAYRFQHKDGKFRWLAQWVDLEPRFDGSLFHCVGFLRRLDTAACSA